MALYAGLAFFLPFVIECGSYTNRQCYADVTAMTG